MSVCVNTLLFIYLECVCTYVLTHECMSGESFLCYTVQVGGGAEDTFWESVLSSTTEALSEDETTFFKPGFGGTCLHPLCHFVTKNPEVSLYEGSTGEDHAYPLSLALLSSPVI